MTTVPGLPSAGDSHEGLTDHELCDLIREGEAWPLDLLWRRHSAEARAWANKKDLAAADDVVSESFTLVFQALLSGGGPSESFRGYLYRTMDSVFVKHWGAQKRTSPFDDLDVLSMAGSESSPDALEEEQEQAAAAAALTELPDRWRQAIIAVDIEGRPVQAVAQELDLSPNSTSVLLKRAREGLRRAWMQNLHRPSADLAETCAHAVKHFGIVRWGKKGTRRRNETENHLEGCGPCRTRYAQFIERASSIGLSLAGLIALSREWREKLIPTLATTAVVAASFTMTITLVPPFPEWLPQPDTTEIVESPAPAESGTDEEQAGDRGSQGSRPKSDPDGAASGDLGANERSGENADGESGIPSEDAGPDHLYFGDWTGWNEDQDSFNRRP